MKKLGLHIVGALVLSSIPMHTALAFKKRRTYECYSDKKIQQSHKIGFRELQSDHEYTARVSDFAGTSAYFVAKKNILEHNNKIRTETITSGEAHFENTGKYLVIQANEWALAVAPEKKRASLYSSNPDINEIPMFCLSESIN